jgi:4-carboxymuconolactone decarboxylase
MDDQQRRDGGMGKRRKVLGNAWVDKSQQNRNAFNAEFQDLITRYAWGEIWTRPHFDERTRRILVIGTLLALCQWDEFKRWPRVASPPTTSRKSSCSRRSIAACPPPTTR